MYFPNSNQICLVYICMLFGSSFWKKFIWKVSCQNCSSWKKSVVEIHKGMMWRFVTQELQRIRGSLRQKCPRHGLLGQEPGARLALLKRFQELVLWYPSHLGSACAEIHLLHLQWTDSITVWKSGWATNSAASQGDQQHFQAASNTVKEHDWQGKNLMGKEGFVASSL